MSEKCKPKDYEVGYGKPPSHSRFRKGQSGNPKGRPKGAKGVAASLRRELESTITVQEGGRSFRISKAEAIAKRTVQLALKGEISVVRMIHALDSASATRGEQEPAAADGEARRDRTDADILAYYAAQLLEEHGLTAPSDTPPAPFASRPADQPHQEDDDHDAA